MASHRSIIQKFYSNQQFYQFFSFRCCHFLTQQSASVQTQADQQLSDDEDSNNQQQHNEHNQPFQQQTDDQFDDQIKDTENLSQLTQNQDENSQIQNSNSLKIEEEEEEEEQQKPAFSHPRLWFPSRKFDQTQNSQYAQSRLTVWIKDCKDVEQMYNTIKRHEKIMRSDHVVYALQKLRWIRVQPKERGTKIRLMRILVKHFNQNKKEYSAKLLGAMISGLVNNYFEFNQKFLDNFASRTNHVAYEADGSDCAMLLYGFSHANVTDKIRPHLIELLTYRLIKERNKLTNKDISLSLWALGKTKPESRPEIQILEPFYEMIEKNVLDFGPRDLSSCLQGLANLNMKNKDILGLLSKRIIELIRLENQEKFDNPKRKFNVRTDFLNNELATVSWSLATFQYLNIPLMEEIFDRSSDYEVIQKFDPQQIANLLWTCARLDYRHENFFEQIIPQIQKDLGKQSPQGLAIIAWALSEMQDYFQVFEGEEEGDEEKNEKNEKIAELLENLIKESTRRIGGFSARDVANVTGAFARFQRFYDDQFWQAIHQQTFRAFSVNQEVLTEEDTKISDSEKTKQNDDAQQQNQDKKQKNQRLGLKNYKELHKQQNLGEIQGENQIFKFNEHNLQDMFMSFGLAVDKREEIYDRRSFCCLCFAATLRSEFFTPKQIALILWSLGKIRHKDQNLVEKLMQNFVRFPESEITPQSIVFAAWGLARLNLSIEQILPQISDCVINKIEIFQPREISNLIWAISLSQSVHNFQFENNALIYKTLVEKLNEFLPETLESNLLTQIFNSRMLTSVIQMQDWWDILNDRISHMAEQTWRNSVGSISEDQISHTLFLNDRISNISDQIQRKNVGFKSNQKSDDQISRAVSKLQWEVYNALKLMDYKPSMEHKAGDGLLSVDILLRSDSGKRIAIEVDGPFHFTRGGESDPQGEWQGGDLMGPTAGRNLLLNELGYTLVSVPYFEWQPLNAFEKREYLMKKLAAVM